MGADQRFHGARRYALGCRWGGRNVHDVVISSGVLTIRRDPAGLHRTQRVRDSGPGTS